jgi:methionyl-tRNA formyltransferase
MKVALAGNNDGPLRLWNALLDAGSASAPRPHVVAVGLEKPVSPELRERYDAAEARSRTVPPNSSRTGPRLFEAPDEETLRTRLASFDLDVLISVFCTFRFRALLEEDHDVWNVHLAPLPAYRGRHPVQWALINGESEFGVTIHRMTEDWDAGEILWQEHVPVDRHMSVAALRERLLACTEQHIPAVLDAWAANRLTPAPNPDRQATYVARRFPEDSRLRDWRDADRVVRTVMALRSESYAAYFVVGERRVVARDARLGERVYEGVAAPFICRTGRERMTVVCRDGRTVDLGDLSCSPDAFRVNDRIDCSPA